MALQGILHSYLKEFNQSTGELCSILFYSGYPQRGAQHYINFLACIDFMGYNKWTSVPQSIWLHMHLFFSYSYIYCTIINPCTSREELSTNKKQNKNHLVRHFYLRTRHQTFFLALDKPQKPAIFYLQPS